MSQFKDRAEALGKLEVFSWVPAALQPSDATQRVFSQHKADADTSCG